MQCLGSIRKQVIETICANRKRAYDNSFQKFNWVSLFIPGASDCALYLDLSKIEN